MGEFDCVEQKTGASPLSGEFPPFTDLRPFQNPFYQGLLVSCMGCVGNFLRNLSFRTLRKSRRAFFYETKKFWQTLLSIYDSMDKCVFPARFLQFGLSKHRGAKALSCILTLSLVKKLKAKSLQSLRAHLGSSQIVDSFLFLFGLGLNIHP